MSRIDLKTLWITLYSCNYLYKDKIKYLDFNFKEEVFNIFPQESSMINKKRLFSINENAWVLLYDWVNLYIFIYRHRYVNALPNRLAKC